MFVIAVTVVTSAGELTESVDVVNIDWVLWKSEGGKVSEWSSSAIVQNYITKPHATRRDT